MKVRELACIAIAYGLHVVASTATSAAEWFAPSPDLDEDEPANDFPYQVQPVVVTPEAAEMVARPAPPAPVMPTPALAGSVAARGRRGATW